MWTDLHPAINVGWSVTLTNFFYYFTYLSSRPNKFSYMKSQYHSYDTCEGCTTRGFECL